MKVLNEYGVMIDFDVAVELMDDELRDKLAMEAFETEQEFFDAYAEAHYEKFGEEWELAKPHPQY